MHRPFYIMCLPISRVLILLRINMGRPRRAASQSGSSLLAEPELKKARRNGEGTATAAQPKRKRVIPSVIQKNGKTVSTTAAVSRTTRAATGQPISHTDDKSAKSVTTSKALNAPVIAKASKVAKTRKSSAKSVSKPKLAKSIGDTGARRGSNFSTMTPLVT